ncbi:polyamine deacetylase HDAC10 isoform X7 [Physeter macrocephalus]|uniref:Polyamine deacetylase HDAC10 isoform X7 n=1 Tax=Physeter macrocephalus TaxID=9755 RepID=A0A9W2WPZ1_PHYMC|nr:polyamine deacetylase HDAC10 isoform X7 [Physeter catodon]
MGTALVYHEDMTAARLLWDDPECEIECPERLTTALERLQQRGLEQRCLRLAAREASEAELGLVHSPEYVALLQGTQALGTRELQTLSGQYDAVYFHPSTFHCARLAAGAALQLVDAVLAGAVRNGLALVRPPGHHSQRAAANGFCVFNNVAIAAKHAQRQHGLHRILIVDWDVHHGQGIQHIFEDDPSVLYFSWHRYEHGRFWPYLRESDADAVGQGPGLGFTVNLPWNQVGMGNADYVAAFLHVLLPVAFEFNPELVLVSAGFDSAIGDPEGQMQATPECFAHLTQLLQVLAGGRVCAVLEGGYHLESLSQSVCMMVQALLGDPAPPLSGPMVPHGSALESIQSVRVAQAPHWVSLQQQGVAPVLSPSPRSPEGRPSPLLLPGGPEFKAAATQDVAALSSLLDQLRLNPTPPVRTAVALTAPDAALALPSDVLCEEGSAAQEETQAWARPHEALAQDRALTALGKVLYLLDRILDGQKRSNLTSECTGEQWRCSHPSLCCSCHPGCGHSVWPVPRSPEEESMAEYWGQGGSCPVHVPRLCATARASSLTWCWWRWGPPMACGTPKLHSWLRCFGAQQGAESWPLWMRNPHPSLRWSWPGCCMERQPPAWVPSPWPPQTTCRP